MSTDYSEDAIVEQPAIALFSQLGYEAANCFYEKVGTGDSTLGRDTTEEVVLVPRVRAALVRLNPDLPSEAIELAIEELTRDRGAMSLVQANHEVYKLLKDGVKVSFEDEADDPFRLVFVCAMWLTGFDSPSVSTIYLDKPMKNHTLMQTIARANRVFKDKHNGLIVDYGGVFRNLEKALGIYGSSSGGGVDDGECPIEKKEELVEDLRLAIGEAVTFCEERGVDLDAILNADGFQKIAFLDDAASGLVDKQVATAVDDAVENVIINDELKKKFLSLAGQVIRLYKAILPDPSANEFAPIKACLAILADKIRNFTEEASIDDILDQVGELLDESIATKGYVIHATEEALGSCGK